MTGVARKLCEVVFSSRGDDVDAALQAVLDGLADDADAIRDVALLAGKQLVRAHGDARENGAAATAAKEEETPQTDRQTQLPAIPEHTAESQRSRRSSTRRVT